jgi:hypothetical protein
MGRTLDRVKAAVGEDTTVTVECRQVRSFV